MLFEVLPDKTRVHGNNLILRVKEMNRSRFETFAIQISNNEADVLSKVKELEKLKASPEDNYNFFKNFLKVKIKVKEITPVRIDCFLRDFFGLEQEKERTEEQRPPVYDRVVLPRLFKEKWCAWIITGKQRSVMTPGNGVFLGIIAKVPIFLLIEENDQREAEWCARVLPQHLQQDVTEQHKKKNRKNNGRETFNRKSRGRYVM